MPFDKKHRILLVDDEEGILKALGRLLKVLNVDLVTATGGAQALEIIKDQEISLIISDQRVQ